MKKKKGPGSSLGSWEKGETHVETPWRSAGVNWPSPYKIRSRQLPLQPLLSECGADVGRNSTGVVQQWGRSCRKENKSTAKKQQGSEEKNHKQLNPKSQPLIHRWPENYFSNHSLNKQIFVFSSRHRCYRVGHFLGKDFRHIPCPLMKASSRISPPVSI